MIGNITRYSLLWMTLALAACAQPNETPPPMAAPAMMPSASLPGPAEPSLARIYFYRDTGTYLHPAWTAVWLNGAKVGDSAPGTYFYRDVRPGTYTVKASSEQPYAAQYETATVVAGTTNFVKIYPVEGYGVSAGVSAASGHHDVGPLFVNLPSVFAGSFVNPPIALHDIVGLKPAG
jgi:Protein of unknown function (DUF2846)